LDDEQAHPSMLVALPCANRSRARVVASALPRLGVVDNLIGFLDLRIPRN